MYKKSMQIILILTTLLTVGCSSVNTKQAQSKDTFQLRAIQCSKFDCSSKSMHARVILVGVAIGKIKPEQVTMLVNNPDILTTREWGDLDFKTIRYLEDSDQVDVMYNAVSETYDSSENPFRRTYRSGQSYIGDEKVPEVRIIPTDKYGRQTYPDPWLERQNAKYRWEHR